jgi:hypothetical protein
VTYTAPYRIVDGAAAGRRPGITAAWLNGLAAMVTKTAVYDVRNWGTTAADVASAISEAKKHGGGIVYLGPGTYNFDGAVTQAGGLKWAVGVDADNIHIRGDGAGATTITTSGDAAPFFLNGTLKHNDAAHWWYYRHQGQIAYPISAAAAGDRTITLSSAADAANFAVGDYAYIRTGQLLAATAEQPDAELNIVTAITGAVLSLRYPLAKPYQQEYFAAADVSTTLAAGVTLPASTLTLTSTAGIRNTIGWVNVGGQVVYYREVVGNTLIGCTGGTGAILAGATVWYGKSVTTLASTSYPAVLGVANVTSSVLRNVSVSDIGFSCPALGSFGSACLLGGYIHGLQVDRVTADTNQRLWDFTNVRGARYRDLVVRNTAASAAGNHFYLAGGDTGSSDIEVSGCRGSSQGTLYLHIHEGVANLHAHDNTILNGVSTSGKNAVSIRARAYNIAVDDNRIHHPSGNGTDTIYVDEKCTAGGRVRGNELSGGGGTTIRGQGWDYQAAPNQDAPHVQYGPTTTRAWVLVGVINMPRSDQVAPATLGVIPQWGVVLRVGLYVHAAFDAGATIEIGHSADTDAYGTATAVSTTGWKTVSAGAGVGYQTAARTVIATLAGTGAAGKAFVYAECFQGPHLI